MKRGGVPSPDGHAPKERSAISVPDSLAIPPPMDPTIRSPEKGRIPEISPTGIGLESALKPGSRSPSPPHRWSPVAVPIQRIPVESLRADQTSLEPRPRVSSIRTKEGAVWADVSRAGCAVASKVRTEQTNPTDLNEKPVPLRLFKGPVPDSRYKKRSI